MNQEINDAILDLDYNPELVLSYEGDSYKSINEHESLMEDGQYIVVTNERKEVCCETFDIAIVNSINNVVFPGALMLGDESLVNNSPTVVTAHRNPISIGVDLPGMTDDSNVMVDNPSLLTVRSKSNELVNAWFDNYSEKYKHPAVYQYSKSKIKSNEHLRIVTGFDLGGMLKLDFSGVKNNTQQSFVIIFKQIFYNVSVEKPIEPGDFFKDEETWAHLERKGVGNDAPPVYVSNVAFGRTIYLSLMTSNMSDDYEAKINAAIKGNTLNAEVFADSTFDNTEYRVVVQGGDPNEATTLTTENFDAINAIIIGNSVLSPSNMGVPISYTGLFLKDNRTAVINSSTEYVETTYKRYNSGSVELYHKGGYVAKFYVTWKERSYVDGVETIKNNEWSDNGANKTASFSTVIPLPANATDIHVMVTEKTGLAWEKWRTVVDQNIPLLPAVKVTVWGTTLKPKHSVDLIG